MSRVIGRGGQGCVLSPALVFPNSRTVQVYNADQFVTKISESAPEEYDVGLFIQTLTEPSIGVFPVDDLFCGITRARLGPNADTIIAECEKTVHISRSSAQYNFRGGHLMAHHLDGGASMDEPIVCAIQYEKYDTDLRQTRLKEIQKITDYDDIPVVSTTSKGTVLYTLDDQNLGTVLFSIAFDKLKILHDAKIVHLDIKGLNMALMRRLDLENTSQPQNIDIRFADFGFAAYLKERDDIFMALKRTLQMWPYYTKTLVGKGEVLQLAKITNFYAITLKLEQLLKNAYNVFVYQTGAISSVLHEIVSLGLRIVDYICLLLVFAPVMDIFQFSHFLSDIEKFVNKIKQDFENT